LKTLGATSRYTAYALFGLAISGANLSAADDRATAAQRLSRYLQVDTVNPPGNESRGVDYLAGILEKHGIPYSRGESAPGRGNLWARLEGGNEPGLVLLHHIDVVPSHRESWSFEPLSGEVKDGYVHGRGALDTKGLGIVQLQAFLALANSGRPLRRDVWYVASADEEAGGAFGAGWLIEAHPEIFADVGYLLNEGGAVRQIGEGLAVMVEVTQKVPLWLRLSASGRPGHGSAPQVETAVPAVAEMFLGLATLEDESMASFFEAPQQAITDDEFMLSLQLENPGTHALLRNTCSITRLTGSAKINVVPALAQAELDCRLLPDQDPDTFIEELATIINDDDVQIERIMGFSPAVSSVDTDLFETLRQVSNKHFPGARVVPHVAAGFTDSHFFRDLGITSYGYSPFMMSVGESRGVHGNDERISVENLQRGTQVMTEILQEFTLER
jgi:acetylornithine deacetylase/succinyl-diaminopimelate desuccinylase-like protein